MELYLIRHARAFERDSAAWPDDSKRPLTHQGRARFAGLARRLARTMPAVDLVESSRFTRAWQTALLLENHAEWPAPVRYEALEADGDEILDSMVNALAAMRGLRRLAWVGHEPQLGRIASRLLAGSPDAVSIEFRKGAVLKLVLPGDPRAPASLGWMVTPRFGRSKRS